MTWKRVLANIFSNWTNLAVALVIAFVVSPILVHRLGDELYGIWTLIISVTGYFTVLDFGVNTAIVRYVSRYEASGEHDRARAVFSTSFAIFLAVGVGVAVLSAVVAPLFPHLFDVPDELRTRVSAVFAVIAIDVVVNLVTSVYMATLKARHEFFKINLVSIQVRVLKNVLIVLLLFAGYSILTLSAVHLGATALRSFCMFLMIRPHYRLRREDVQRDLTAELVGYSLFSLIISLMIKVIFYTDSVLVGKLVGLDSIVYYAIPVTLLLYSERLVYAAMSVLTPIVSANEAQQDLGANRAVYLYGTRYSLALILPVIFVLFTNGPAFIGIWMGPRYGVHSSLVLRILLAGYLFYLSQIVANSVLKGVSRHRVLALILVGQALANLGLSIALGRVLGIEGIAIGAAIPMILVNALFVPAYSCHVLGISYGRYMAGSYLPPLAILAAALALDSWFPFRAESYLQLAAYALVWGAILLAVGAVAVVDPKHRLRLIASFRAWLASRKS